jgi:pimeloyl-ACP methyl ester carboxylesterase/DNA-binding SARP family transcriptional activator
VPDIAWSRRDASSLVKVLALTPDRRMHREQLIDRLWPDLSVDEAAPRLHKAAHYARKAVGRANAVVLRQEMVALLPGSEVSVDLPAFEAEAEAALADGSPAAAEAVLARYDGDPLPADAYADWADEARQRLAAARERLLRQAARWQDLVDLDPTDEHAHLELMRAQVRDGDRLAALRQYERLDHSLQRELGVGPGPEPTRLRDEQVATLRRLGSIDPSDEGRLEQQIRFCRTRDDVTIAYAYSGDGPPLVKAANWLTHVDHEWRSPVWRHWLLELSRRHRLIRYDERGCGLSDWEMGERSFEAWVHDLETVVDEVGLDRFPLLGISQGAAVAVAYAARHPERVTRLVLYGSYAHGRAVRGASEESRRKHEVQVELARLGWGQDDPAFRQVFTSQFMPDGSRELWTAFNELQRSTTSPENAASVLEISGGIDVVEEAQRVRVPTFVLHARRDQRPPFEQGRRMASLIPGSRFMALDSNNHILLEDEPAWPVFLTAVERFLAEGQRTDARSPAVARGAAG